MSQPPSLLTLPTEIRLKILHFALYIPSRTHSLPHAISVFWPRAFNDPYKYKPAFYGTECMSDLMVVSHLLHSELEEILFTRFIFSFPHYMRLPSIQNFTTTISPRARTLLRAIMVGIHLDLGYDETEEFIRNHNRHRLKPAKEALRYLKIQLPGLARVHLSVGFVSGPFNDMLAKRRVDEFADMVMDLVSIFTPRIKVVIANKDHQQCRKDIMMVCEERLAVLMSKTEIETVGDSIAILKFSEGSEASTVIN